ncbi:hypothetical protein [Paraconexibacter sp.]|uniref:hypothetical protein n=1 Tax=Paraconexibacter sp. TaxID=2949640 RepID=UPI0035649F57
MTVTATVLGVCSAAEGFRPSDRITKNGLGTIQIGMTVSQIADRSGRRPDVTYFNDRSCGTAKLGSKVYGMFSHGRLIRIDVGTSRYRTRKGVHVRDTVKRVYARYGRRISARPHAYVPGGKYLRVTTRNRRIVFETNASGKVTSVVTGRIPEVDYVESCA